MPLQLIEIVSSLVLLYIFVRLLRCINFVQEGNIGVVSQFGKYKRLAKPGLNLIWPWERLKPLNIQTRTLELEFKAITQDQANVSFTCTILFTVEGENDGSVIRAMYAFESPTDFNVSLTRLIEDETRAYVANKKQTELISISQEVAGQIKGNLDTVLQDWGYRIIDLRYSNLKFDELVTHSMARVVAALNECEAAEHEGNALLIKKVKDAEANGEYVRIAADAEREAWKLRGIGLAEFRREVAKGIHDAVEELQLAGVDPNYLLFFMHTEALKHIAEHSKAGNTIFINTHPAAPRDVIEQFSAFYKVDPTSSTDVSQTSS